MSWHRDKLHSESHSIPLGELSITANCSKMLDKERFLYWCDALALSGCDLSQNNYGSESPGWLSPHPFPGITWICVFFSFWSPPVSQGRAGSSDGPWAHCSPSALLSLAAGLQLHLEPWSYIKILKFSPNRICRWEQRWCCIARRFSLQTSSSPWGGNPITLYV